RPTTASGSCSPAATPRSYLRAMRDLGVKAIDFNFAALMSTPCDGSRGGGRQIVSEERVHMLACNWRLQRLFAFELRRWEAQLRPSARISAGCSLSSNLGLKENGQHRKRNRVAAPITYLWNPNDSRSTVSSSQTRRSTRHALYIEPRGSSVEQDRTPARR